MNKKLNIGTIAQAKYFNGVANLDDTQKYQQLLKENFNSAGMFAFGQMPFVAKGPNLEKDYDWKNIDGLVEWGVQNNVEIQYNTVINSHHNSFPEWYYGLSQADRKTVIKTHVKAVISRYKGRIKWFKLVNEARPYENNYLETGENRIDLIADIFTWAKEEYPEGIFVLNDHIPFLVEDDMRQQYIHLIEELLNVGAPIDAIGIEGHLGYRPRPHELPHDEAIDVTLDSIHAASNLPIYITEFDLSYDNEPLNSHGQKINPEEPFKSQVGDFPSWFEYQAYAYRHFYELVSKKDFVTGLTYWGFSEKDWPKWERPGVGFFDENFSPKSAFGQLKSMGLKKGSNTSR